MTSTLDRPVAAPSPSPRGPGARALTWTGAAVGGVLLLSGAYSAVGLLAERSGDATTVTESATYDAAEAVEIIADGPITVTTGGDRFEVERTASTVLSATHYDADVLGDRLRVSFRCDWWRPGFCSAALDVTVPDGTAVVVRASDGSVTASSLHGPLDVHVSDGETDVSEVVGRRHRPLRRRPDQRQRRQWFRLGQLVGRGDRRLRRLGRGLHPVQRRPHGDLPLPQRHRRPRERRQHHRLRHGGARRARHLHRRRRPDRRGPDRPDVGRARADPHQRRPRGLPGTARLTSRGSDPNHQTR